MASFKELCLLFPQVKSLEEGIAAFYDESSALWEAIWGQHMHHGYYPKGRVVGSSKDAQVDMIEEVLKWAGVHQTKRASLPAAEA